MCRDLKSSKEGFRTTLPNESSADIVTSRWTFVFRIGSDLLVFVRVELDRLERSSRWNLLLWRAKCQGQVKDAKEEEQRLRHCWDEGLTVVCCFNNDSMICLKEKRKNVKKDLK